MQQSPAWVAYVTAVGAVVTPIVVIILGAVVYRIRIRFERRLNLESELRTDRVQIYQDILDPFILLFTPDAAWKSDSKHRSRNKEDVIQEKLLSIDYRRSAFKLALIGSDGVVRAYNELMQHFYQGADAVDEPTGADPTRAMNLLGDFLLQIRRSMGNETTRLDNLQMLEWFISDVRAYRAA